MNKHYCYVVVQGERVYLSDAELAKANVAAQAEADRTGLAVKRQNSRDTGHSLFYPKKRWQSALDQIGKIFNAPNVFGPIYRRLEGPQENSTV